MKKILMLLLFVMATFVSQAWGAYAPCATDLGNTFYCDWGTGCYELNKGATDADNCTTVYNNCKKDGYLFTGVPSTSIGDNKKCTGTWVGEGNDPNFNSGVKIWCKWATSCQPLKNQTELDNCIRDGSVFKDVPDTGIGEGKACTGGTWTEQGKNPNIAVLGCCKWSTETNCYPIYDETKDGKTGATQVAECQMGSNKFWAGSGACPESCPTTTPTYPVSSSSVAGTSSSSVAAGTSSSSAGGSSSSGTGGSSSSTDAGTSSSSDDGTPIISHNNAPVFGLSVVNFARSLQIASDKNATISLFNINGKLVLSQKVLSGTTTISLANQKVGVYYAIAKSGSQKQIVKIVLR